MVNTLSEIRVARSHITHEAGGTRTTQEIDWDLGLREAVEIFAVMGVVTSFAALTPTATPVALGGAATLHLEDDNPRTMEIVTGDGGDTVRLDDEVIFLQGMNIILSEDETNNNATAAIQVLPEGLIVFPQTKVAALNLTHAVELSSTSFDCVHHLEIHYRYVSLSQQELAIQIARRR